MQCFVYKSLRRAETFVFLARRDDFEPLPEPLRARLGDLQFVVEFELTPERRLARAEAPAVIASLAERGFHLQLPPGESARDDALD